MKNAITSQAYLKSSIFAAAIALCCFASPLFSQGTQQLDQTVAHALDSLPTGTPVRVYLFQPPNRRVDGRLLRYDRGSVLINPTDSMSNTLKWKVDEIDKVYALGRRSDGWAFGHGAGVGALVGLGIGVAVTAILAATGDDLPCSEICIPKAAASAVLTIPFTALTTIVGGFIGLNDREKWRSVAIPLAPSQPQK